MPSRRKRIGYLPSVNAQEMISKIANTEKASQSKVVGILVEEALIAREKLDPQGTNDYNRTNLYGKKKKVDNPTFKFNDIDELISDKGIIYNTSKYKNTAEDNLFEPKEKYSDELFEQFKQFILFQKMIQDK